MVPRILVCDNCGSEKFEGRTCAACRGLSDEEWAINQAKADYVDGKLDTEGLEGALELILANPKASPYVSPFDRPHIIYR
jgi:hypothetical protein